MKLPFLPIKHKLIIIYKVSKIYLFLFILVQVIHSLYYSEYEQ